MSEKYTIISVNYPTFSNENPSLITDTYRWGKLDELIKAKRLFFNDDRMVTFVGYDTAFGIKSKNPGLYSDVKKDTAVPLETAIKDKRLYITDTPTIHRSGTTNDRDYILHTTAMYNNSSEGAGHGGKRKKSRKPKRRNSRSKRRNSRSNRTLNKSKK